MFTYIHTCTAPSTALPLGTQSHFSNERLERITPSNELINSIVGISTATDEDKVITSPVIGFINIRSLNHAQLPSSHIYDFLCLCPTGGTVPSSFGIVGSVKWFDD